MLDVLIRHFDCDLAFAAGGGPFGHDEVGVCFPTIGGSNAVADGVWLGGESLRKMNGLQPSHEIRKLSITLPVHVVDALRLKLKGDETITDCIKRLVTREALGVATNG